MQSGFSAQCIRAAAIHPLAGAAARSKGKHLRVDAGFPRDQPVTGQRVRYAAQPAAHGSKLCKGQYAFTGCRGSDALACMSDKRQVTREHRCAHLLQAAQVPEDGHQDLAGLVHAQHARRLLHVILHEEVAPLHALLVLNIMDAFWVLWPFNAPDDA